MNKSELNRKIQLLEQANEELERINRKLRNTNCIECNKVREVKNKSLRRKYNEILSVMSGIDSKYTRGGY